MIRRLMLMAAVLLLSANLSRAQNKNETGEVRLFQTFFEDVPIATAPYGEGFFQYADFDGDLSIIDIAVQAAFPVAPNFQIGGALGFERSSLGKSVDQSGLTDLLISGRYNVLPGPTAISIGALMTLPIGSEDVGRGNFNFSGFGALRQSLASGLVLTGALALEFIEQFNDRKTGLLIAGGVIAPLANGLNLVSELNLRSRYDYALLTGGVDYALDIGGRIRGGIGLGLDNGAPNFIIRGGYFLGF